MALEEWMSDEQTSGDRYYSDFRGDVKICVVQRSVDGRGRVSGAARYSYKCGMLLEGMDYRFPAAHYPAPGAQASC